jgi:hypothetical protein
MLPLELMRGAQSQVVHGERFLTGWTLAGRRTVDLRRLVMVDRRGMSRTVYGDVLVLRDADGMELTIALRTDLSRTAVHGLGLADVPMGERLTSNVPWAVKGLLYDVASLSTHTGRPSLAAARDRGP